MAGLCLFQPQLVLDNLTPAKYGQRWLSILRCSPAQGDLLEDNLTPRNLFELSRDVTHEGNENGFERFRQSQEIKYSTRRVEDKLREVN